MINNLLNIIYEYGWFMAIFLLIIYSLYKFVSINYKNWMDKSKTLDDEDDPNESTHESLAHHPFFSNAQYRLKVEIPNMDLVPNKPIRETVFKDLLDITFTNVYAICTEIVNIPDMESWHHDEWVDELTKKINEIAINIEVDAEKRGIPDIIIKKFSRWNLSTIEALREYVLMLGHSKLYTTNVAKTNTFLFIMNLLLVTTLGDAERTIRVINGELTGILYKGIPIE